MAKCDKCVHKEICRHEENMKKYEVEIKEKSKLMEYQMFDCEIRCKRFSEEKMALRGPY